MSEEQNRVIFTTEENETIEFCVIEQTKLNGATYLLVTEAEEEDDEGIAYILKDLSKDTEEASVYTMVEDEKELELIGNIFGELLEDIDIETE